MLKIQQTKTGFLVHQGNPNSSHPTILSHSDSDSCMDSDSDPREELFDSSLHTVNVSVNTELPMDFSYGPREEKFDFLHFYGEMNDDDFHRMMSVDDLTYSIAFSDEVFDNGKWHTYAGLETCNVIKPTRHGKEPLGKSIQNDTISFIALTVISHAFLSLMPIG